MKKLLILLVMATPLCGCLAIPAAMVASATVGGAVIYDKRSFKTMSQDQNAYTFAKHALDKDPMLKDHSHISVAVFNNIALLVGQAQTPEIRNRAYQIVSNLQNIKRVYNEITIGNSTSTMQRADDSWITTKVKSALVAKPGLRSTNLKVVTENGSVYLMGHVTRKQAALATDAARRISGVTKVVQVFEYEQ